MTYSVVVPVYNEQPVADEGHRRLSSVMDACGQPYEIIFVDDGSSDGTLQKLECIAEADTNVKVVSFSRNFGQMAAISAGMDLSAGQAIIVIDVDMQDPPEVIPQFIEKWAQGYDVVYGKRVKRKGETVFKRVTAVAFYRFLNAITGINLPPDAGEFRLISRPVCEAIKAMPERARYVRGLVAWAGFKQAGVEYVREERFAGETKYSLKKMLRLASDGIMSFSQFPLKLSMWAGGIVAIASVVYMVVNLVSQIKSGEFSQLPYVVGFLALTQAAILAALGLIGGYLGRVYDEAKGRPLYIVAKKIGWE